MKKKGNSWSPLTAGIRHRVVFPAIDVLPIFKSGVEEVCAAAEELPLKIVPGRAEAGLCDVPLDDLGCSQREEGLLQEEGS